MSSFTSLPDDLPVPGDDGAADHLRGAAAPPVRLSATDGAEVQLDQLGEGRQVIYVYPMTGRPGDALPEGWDAVPGARGCTTEACDFRDHLSDLAAAGASAVYGLSSQTTDYQAEAVDRLRLPFPLLSDPDFDLAEALSLPTFDIDSRQYYKRLTLVVRDGEIEHVFYPIFPPNEHARQVLAWLNDNPLEQS